MWWLLLLLLWVEMMEARVVGGRDPSDPGGAASRHYVRIIARHFDGI